MMFDGYLIKVDRSEKEDKSSTHSDTVGDNINGEAERRFLEKEDISPYEKKYFALLQRCEIIKQSNERLVNRIYHVKKLLRRRKKERKFLMDRLDGYGDDYRNIALSLFAEMIGDNSPPRNAQVSGKPDVFLASQSQVDPDS